MSEFIEYCNEFDCIQGDDQSKVFQIFPKVFEDDRGSFTEVLKDFGQWPKDNIPIWFSNLSWIRQINRSVSDQYVCRGMHAQSGVFCQSKLVECTYGKVIDFIIDARPDSKTFGLFKAFILDSKKANKLFVPKGFLHGFYSVDCSDCEADLSQNIFQYYIGGGTYCKTAEVGIDIRSILPRIVDSLKNCSEEEWELAQLVRCKDKIILSDKDKNGLDYDSWMKKVQDEYKSFGKKWYR